MRIDKALVVYNKPLYEIHVLEEKDPHYLRLLRNRHPTTKNWQKVYETHRRTLQGVDRTMRLLGIQTEFLFRKKLKKVGKVDLVITVGGDGTFLETSHFITGNQVLLGINAALFDSTGALCRARLENLLEVLIDLLAGNREPKAISRLKIQVGKKTLPYPVLNEVLFANQSPAGTSRYLIKLGAREEKHKSSGIWIATATGSTAALRSSGGAPMNLSHRGMQFAVRELFPERGKKFKIRHSTLPSHQKLAILSEMRLGALYIDGNRLVVKVPYGEKVVISPDGPKLRAVL